VAVETNEVEAQVHGEEIKISPTPSAKGSASTSPSLFGAVDARSFGNQPAQFTLVATQVEEMATERTPATVGNVDWCDDSKSRAHWILAAVEMADKTTERTTSEG
jgi:hypothetical protein